MSETMVQPDRDQEIFEQKLWRAVITSTVYEWIDGPLRKKREAEHFLFDDHKDYVEVCSSAGIDPQTLRERLQKIRIAKNPIRRTIASSNLVATN